MSDHSSSVFNNSCLKLPRNCKNNNPMPVYEQKILNELQNEVKKISLLSAEKDGECKSDPLKSFIEFYDSIPEYDDVNHLPDKEFYKKVEMLKEKQKTYWDYLSNENLANDWMGIYKNFSHSDAKKHETKPKSSIKPFCVTPIINRSPNTMKNLVEDVELNIDFDKDINTKPPSRRSVRIESPADKEDFFQRSKSRADDNVYSSNSDYPNRAVLDDLYIDECKSDSNTEFPLQTRSAPNSPAKNKPSIGWKDNGITIPKPFEMSVRDDENKIVDDLLASSSKPKNKNPDLFRAHPVPIESQLPLFDKIMADQERKNRVVRERSKALLQAQMRPFSFTRRDEEIQKLTKGLSKSSPELFPEATPIKIKKFKAKPIPRNLFSNYIYKKMHEDEFYRALQKKIRAEEMLKSASLPPSMARRERFTQKYDVCPRSYRDMNLDDKKTRKKRKPRSAQLPDYELEKEFEELKNDFLLGEKCTTRSKSAGSRKKKTSYRNSSASSSESRTPSSMDLSSVSRSNLAAVLRIQSARKRAEMEMCRKLEESKIKEEARWREKLMRKKPVWQTLAYSQEEDLAMRLQCRRDEERLRNEEHRLRMQLMMSRVYQQPTLFERQSQIGCPKTRRELLNTLYPEYKTHGRRSMSDLSDMRSLVEMKDEAIQALLDEEERQNSKESALLEEKENCDSPL